MLAHAPTMVVELPVWESTVEDIWVMAEDMMVYMAVKNKHFADVNVIGMDLRVVGTSSEILYPKNSQN